jgi:uncharacterized protein YbbC (DUF1343 family)
MNYGKGVERSTTMNKGTRCDKKYIISLFRVFFLLFIALVAPRFFLSDQRHAVKNSANVSEANGFKLGLENISTEFLRSLNATDRKDFAYRVGLITNHTGLNQSGKRNIDLLLAKGVHIKKIFVPEDDFLAYKKDETLELIDEQTKIPITMLPHIDLLKKSKKNYAFTDVDVVFFDLQDTGISPHSYLSTLVKTLQSAAAHDKTIVVLDRPNMLGASMEGMLTDVAYGDNQLIAIPMRHGMTFGELARYCNAQLSRSARLYVVPMQNYFRTGLNDSTALAGSLLTNIDTYYGSSFLMILSCVFPFDVGIGTDMAFACLALPESLHFTKQKWFELRTLLKEQGIETSWYRYTNEKKHCSYAGLRLLVRNFEQFSPFATVMTIVQFFKDAGIILTFSSDFDRAFGGKKVRDFLEGKYSRHDLEYEVNKGLKNFFNKAQNSFIYKPTPKIVLL